MVTVLAAGDLSDFCEIWAAVGLLVKKWRISKFNTIYGRFLGIFASKGKCQLTESHDKAIDLYMSRLEKDNQLNTTRKSYS